MPTELTVGANAPAFSIPREGGGAASLDTIGGNGLVLYFYPKADTSGCTKEAQAFSALKSKFDRLGVSVVGVSADPVKRLTSFRKKYDLGIALASDETHEMLEKYGVWVEKSMYGRRYMGVERATFLIRADGRIAQIWRKVKVDGHAEEVLAAAKAL